MLLEISHHNRPCLFDRELGHRLPYLRGQFTVDDFFIRAFCDLKLWHVQFNVINRETLLAAQKDPEIYRGLIVRIAGYSAYFVDLSPDLQNDIIARTQHDSV